MDDGHQSRDVARARDLGVGVAALSVSVAALLAIPSQVSSNAFQSFGDIRSPAFFPIIASALLALCSTALILRSRPRAGAQNEHPHSAPPSPRVLAVAGTLLVAGISLNFVGFLSTACALILALSLAFDAQNYRAVLALALIVPAAIHLLFTSVLNVLLPGGVLF